MHAIQILNDRANTLEWTEVPDPTPWPGEVLVDVWATAVNRADLLQRMGSYNPPPGASEILGLECAGVVSAVGEGVDDALLGKRVAALLSGGGYAERVAVPVDHLLELPDELEFTDAAAIPEVFYTAFLNLCIEGGLRAGETVMLHAAASGVGTAALQICRELGCPVIATASGPKLSVVEDLGAARCVDRNEESFEDAVSEFTDGRGVDVILDPVAADYFERNIDCLAPRGRLVIIGLLSGMRAELNLAALLRRRLRVIGSVLRSRTNEEKTAITERFKQQTWPWLCEGRIAPVIDRVMSIEEASDAHALLRGNETIGKVVLRIPRAQ